MSAIKKIVGFVLLIFGLSGLTVAVPQYIIDSAISSVNPLVWLGIVDGKNYGQSLDLILYGVLFFFGLILILSKDKPVQQFR